MVRRRSGRLHYQDGLLLISTPASRMSTYCECGHRIVAHQGVAVLDGQSLHSRVGCYNKLHPRGKEIANSQCPMNVVVVLFLQCMALPGVSGL
jgi:hypothetical protein